MCVLSTHPCDLLSPGESVLLKVFSQIKEGVFLQVLTVTEDDQQTLLLHTRACVRASTHTNTQNFKGQNVGFVILSGL